MTETGFDWQTFEAKGLPWTEHLVRYVTRNLSLSVRGHVLVWLRCNGWLRQNETAEALARARAHIDAETRYWAGAFDEVAIISRTGQEMPGRGRAGRHAGLLA
jgi:hypothetical protein